MPLYLDVAKAIKKEPVTMDGLISLFRDNLIEGKERKQILRAVKKLRANGYKVYSGEIEGDLTYYIPIETVKVDERTCKDSDGKYAKVLFFGDTHLPDIDWDSWRCVKQFIEYIKPDVIIMLGDMVEFQPLSSFMKLPESGLLLQSDLEVTHKYFTSLRESCGWDCKIVYKEGNHERRLRNGILHNFPELFTLENLKIENLLKLDDFNITYSPYEEDLFINQDFVAIHGSKYEKGYLSQESSYSAKNTYHKWKMSGIMGHTHRLGAYYFRTLKGMDAFYESGCLRNIEPDWVKHPNWQQGIMLGYFSKTSSRFYMQQIPIVHHKFIFDGRRFGDVEHE